MSYHNVIVRDVLKTRLIALGLYDEDRAEELVSRVESNEDAMLKILGRFAVESVRGGSLVQQCIRAIVKTEDIPAALDTYDKLLGHELADPSFPLVT